MKNMYTFEGKPTVKKIFDFIVDLDLKNKPLSGRKIVFNKEQYGELEKIGYQEGLYDCEIIVDGKNMGKYESRYEPKGVKI